ncbi:non-structural maintenance of chromosomes element 1-like protein [Moniliophthora roreri MCA 2997]|nr:non-structural maintenance of chromosomes element 1-like protein [Moniliophthora roreri MCA 2997]
MNVNKSLNDFELEFKGIQDETSGKKLFSLVNRKDDELAQMATDFTPNEIVFFKAIVEQIMLARKESYSLSSIAALGEVTALKDKVKMTKTQAEGVLATFVAKGWLLKSKRGRYSLSPKTLLELFPYLKATYPDEILECTICHDMITKGVACHRNNCKTRMHFHCFKTFRRHKGECPTCQIEWPREATESPLIPVGEDAVRDGEDGKRRVRARTMSDEDTDEDMEDPSQGQTQLSQPSRTQKGRKSKGKGKGRKTVVDEDEDEDAEAGPDEEEEEAPRTQRRRNTRP